MKIHQARGGEMLRLVAFLLFFAATVVLNITCSNTDNNPAANPACGSGHVTWDTKTQVCRDQVDSHVVPNSCCGQ